MKTVLDITTPQTQGFSGLADGVLGSQEGTILFYLVTDRTCCKENGKILSEKKLNF
jgi:hypothetical protein